MRVVVALLVALAGCGADLRQALGENVPDEVALPRFTQPLAIRFFTAQPGPLPTGRVTAIDSSSNVGRVSMRNCWDSLQ